MLTAWPMTADVKHLFRSLICLWLFCVSELHKTCTRVSVCPLRVLMNWGNKMKQSDCQRTNSFQDSLPSFQHFFFLLSMTFIFGNRFTWTNFIHHEWPTAFVKGRKRFRISAECFRILKGRIDSVSIFTQNSKQNWPQLILGIIPSANRMIFNRCHWY